MFWFEKKSYQDFHANLLAEINALPAAKDANVKFTDSSYQNDECGSVMFDLTTDGENYVQLFAFETIEDAKLSLGETGEQYGVTVCINGEVQLDGFETSDRHEAMLYAIQQADKMGLRGFEHEGVCILDISEASNGFPISVDESVEEYTPTLVKLALDHKAKDLDALCLFIQNSIGLQDGGNAAMFWSGREDGLQELQAQASGLCIKEFDDYVESGHLEKIKPIVGSIPDDILAEYIESEIRFHLGE